MMEGVGFGALTALVMKDRIYKFGFNVIQETGGITSL
jgi:hypothetical protein